MENMSFLYAPPLVAALLPEVEVPVVFSRSNNLNEKNRIWKYSLQNQNNEKGME